MHKGACLYPKEMAKRTLHITIAMLLLAATTGVTVAWHYCGAQIRHTEIAVGADHYSCAGDMEMPMGQCHNHVESKHVHAAFTMSAAAPAIALAHCCAMPPAAAAVSLVSAKAVSTQRISPLEYLPPGEGNGISIPVFVQSFLI